MEIESSHEDRNRVFTWALVTVNHTVYTRNRTTTTATTMATSKTLRIALAQICPKSGKEGAYPAADADPFEVLHANLEDIAANVKQAKEQGADVVCFPEYLQGILNEGRQVCPPLVFMPGTAQEG